MPSCRGRSSAFALAIAASLVAVAQGPAAMAVVRASLVPTDEQLFAKPPVIRKQVRFWEKIFFTYPSTTVVVHESTEPDRMIDVIDYRTLNGLRPSRLPVPRKEREAVTKRYLKRYEKALQRFALEKAAAVRYGAIEQRLFDTYEHDPVGLRRLYDGTIRLRAQTGLADDFIQASASAQAYLPFMERIFDQYEVPRRLTRLPFVESMFNLKARSKVGASGIWQFMPATARNFLFINDLVDERNAPEKATRAAAQFLLNNYRALGSWPLAVTAYNHGREGMARAQRQLATSDIGAIVEQYNSPSFGFASRNFYAEFLAAGNVYERLQRQRRLAPASDLPEGAAVLLKQPMSVKQLLQTTGLTGTQLQELNPCLLSTTLTTNAHKPLPAYYEIKVPKQHATFVKKALLLHETTRYAKK